MDFQKIKDDLEKIKNDVVSAIGEDRIRRCEEKAKSILKRANDDIQGLAGKDLEIFKKRLKDEKEKLDLLIATYLPKAIEKASGIIEKHEKEISFIKSKYEDFKNIATDASSKLLKIIRQKKDNK